MLEADTGKPWRAIRADLGSSIDLILQLERRPGKRVMSEVLRMRNYDADGDKYDARGYIPGFPKAAVRSSIVKGQGGRASDS